MNRIAGFKENKKKYLLSAVFLIIVAIFTYKAIFAHYDIRLLFNVAKTARKGYLLGALVCAVVFIWGEGWSIGTIMKAFGYPVSLGRQYKYSAIGFYFSGITPSATGGQPAQVWYMDGDGYPPSAATATILLVSAMYKLVIILFGLVLIFFKADVIFTGVPYFRLLFTAGIIINTLVVAVCITMIFSQSLVRGTLNWSLALGAKIKLCKNPQATMQRLESHLSDYRDAARYLKSNPMLFVKILFQCTITRFVMFSIAFLVYRSFGLAEYSLLDIIALQIATAFAVDSLPLPGGVGASEGVFLGLFSGIYGDTTGAALLLTRGIGFYLPLIISMVIGTCAHITYVKNKRKLRDVKKV